MSSRIKICCISSPEEARMAMAAGANALGLVGKMPSGPGPIPDELIASIVKLIPATTDSFLLTSEQTAEGIISHHRRVNTNTIQIVDELLEGSYEMIRASLPTVKIVQVIHVAGSESITAARTVSSFVDAILLDSGQPQAAMKTLGGTGNRHDWNISRDIVKAVPIPVYLAGGLNAENVQEAIRVVRPFGVDICSGVRTNGKLDKTKLVNFIQAVTSVTV